MPHDFRFSIARNAVGRIPWPLPAFSHGESLLYDGKRHEGVPAQTWGLPHRL
jgi:hypothetical protein